MPFKKTEIKKIARALVEKIDATIPISQAYLFGSYAKGRADAWSDIDIALVSHKFGGIRFNDYKKIIPFLRDFPACIEVHPFRKADFTFADLFVKEIVTSGIKIR